MANVNANINVLINTQGAVGALKNLQAQINNFNRSVAAGNAAMASSQKQLTSNLAAQIAATNAFSTSFQKVETGASKLQTAIDRNRLSLREYFKYGIASSGAFGRVFQKEHNEIMDLAADRVKRLQTQYLALGRAQNGMVETMAVRPLQLHNADAAIGIQRQQLFNKLMRDGATSMVNWGKNTQWAGRQLMVGFTVPLTIFGGYAASVFMDLDKQITQFKRVYGDAMTPTAEADAMVRQIQDLAKEYTKYGITVADSIEMAAKAAATGLQGADLLAATEEALRLATLGQIDYQQALDATISLQSAFDISSQDLANTIDFLNAVENQTIVSLDDISQAIPRVAPVIKGLGGDVRDLAAMLAAMREGGVNAAEGANALKSGLASLINPSKQANEVLKEMGINLDEIVKKNEGDLMGTVQDFATAIQDLSNLDRQKALATLFGKYQFARMGALFKNIVRDGSQAQRVIELAGMSVKELADLSEKDLSRLEESVSVRFLGAFERLKLAIAPIGEEFLKIATPILEWVTQIFERFNELSPEVKKWGLIIVGALGGVLPILVMVAGLFGNFLGNMVKGAAILKGFFGRLARGGRAVGYQTGAMLDATAQTNSLETATNGVTQALNVQKTAVLQLKEAYETFLRGATQAINNLPNAIVAPRIVPSGAAPAGAAGAAGAAATGPATIPGGFGKRGYVNVDPNRAKEDAHFIQRVTLTAAEIDKIIATRTAAGNLPQETKAKLEQLKADIESGKKGIAGYTNQVVSIPAALHRQLTEGTKSISGAQARSIFSEQKIHAQLGGTMLRLGAEAGEVNEATKRLSMSLIKQLDELEQVAARTGTELVITAEQFEQMMQKAYAELGRTRAKTLATAKAAIAEMSQITTITENAGTSRETLPGIVGYKGKADINRYYGAMGRPDFAQQQRFDLSRSLMPLAGFENIENAQKIFKSFSMEAKTALLAVRDDVTQFTAMFIAEMGKTGQLAGTQLSEQFDAAVNGGALVADTMAEAQASRAGRSWLMGGPSPYDPQYAAQQRPRQPEIVAPTGFYSRLDDRRTYGPDGKVIDDFEKKVSGAGDKAEKSGNVISRTASKFGNSLVQGSGKLQGGLFALDGLVFAASFMENQIGDFANKIMPAVFAFQGITMLLPMLTTPWGALIAAVAAVAGGLIYLKMGLDNMEKAGQTMANALIANSEIVNGVGEFFGKESVAQNARIEETAATGEVSTEAIEQAREFLNTDVGQQITSGLADAFSKFGSTASAEQFASSLATMMLQGVINMKEAKSIAAVLGEQLGSETFGIQVIGELQEIVGANGQKIESQPYKIAIEIEAKNKQFVDDFAETFFPQSQQALVEQLGGDMSQRIAESLSGGFGGERLEQSDNILAKVAPLATGMGLIVSALDVVTQSMSTMDNVAGELARAYQAKLNPSVQTALGTFTQFGSFVGNSLAQSYENLYAAQQRMIPLQEKLITAKKAEREESTKATRQALVQAQADYRRAKQQEQVLIEGINNTRKAMEEHFASISGSTEAQINAQLSVIQGLNESIASMYESMGQVGALQQAAFDALGGAFQAGSRGAEFRLKLEIAAGNLSATDIQSLVGVLGTTDIVRNMLVLIETKMGGDTQGAANFLTSVSGAGIDDAEFVKKIMIVAESNFTEQQFNNYAAMMREITLIKNEDLKKVFAVEALGMTPAQMDKFSISIERYNGLPDKLKKVAEIAYEETGPKGFDQAIDALYQWEEISNSSLKKEAKIEMMMDEFDRSEKEIKAFMEADFETKMRMLLEWSTGGEVGKEEPPIPKEMGPPDGILIKTKLGKPEPISETAVREYVPESIEIPVSLEPRTITAEEKQAMEELPLSANMYVMVTGAQEQLDAIVANVEAERLMPVDLGGNVKTEVDGVVNKTITRRSMPIDLGGSVVSDVNAIITRIETPRTITVTVNEVQGTRVFTGGPITRRYAGGGGVLGGMGVEEGTVPGDGSRDTVPALLTPGEFVIRKRSVDQYGESFLQAINMGAYNLGGIVKFGRGGRNGNGDGKGKGKGKDRDPADTNNDGEVSDAEQKAQDIKDALKEFKESMDEIIKKYVDINKNLKDFINGSMGVIDGVLRGSGLQQLLSNAGLNQAMIDEVLGMGIDAAKAWYKKYTNAAGKLTKEGLAQVKAMMVGFINEQITGFQSRFSEAQVQRGALNAAEQRGTGNSVALEIAGDPASAQAYMMIIKEVRKAEENLARARKSGKGVKEAEKEYERAQKAARKYENAVRAALDAEQKLADKIEEVQNVLDQMASFAARRGDAEAQLKSVVSLRKQGASEEIIQEVGGDPEAAKAYTTLLEEQNRAERALAKARESGQGVPKAKKRYKDAQEALNAYQRRVRAAVEAEKELAKALDPVGYAIEQLDKAREGTLKKFNLAEAKFAQAFGEIERAAAPGIKSAEEAVKAAQEQVDMIQDQIDAIEEKNQKEQFAIRGLDRQKEMIQRQIDATERLNEIDQRRIEKLQREDELRNRVAEGLEKELEAMSQQETKIQEAYQERIDALDKVSSVNQQIIDQQKSMLDISQALSQGDVFAAARSVQERKAQQAQFAAEQARNALEAASENAVSNLRTSGGLTREQAEEQINNIREQSYQTSLKIRDLEDQIYARNQANIPLLDKMREIDDQILVIQDRIYANETEILTLQINKLTPAQNLLEKRQDELDLLNEKLETDKANLQIDGLTYDQLQDQIAAEAEAYDLAIAQVEANEENLKSVENIVKKWEDVNKAIAKANRTARIKGEDATGVARSKLENINKLLEKGTIKKEEAERRKERVRSELRARLREIEAERKAAVEKAREGTYYAGGQIRRYATGSIVGTGSRDSVPAWVTPGEFVMRTAAVEKYGTPFMESINNGSFAMPSYSVPASSSFGSSASKSSVSSTFAPVYNSYGINVNVSGTNASADEIATRAVAKIKEMQNMRVRSARV